RSLLAGGAAILGSMPKSAARTLEPDARRTMANPKTSKIVRWVDRFVIDILLAPSLTDTRRRIHVRYGENATAELHLISAHVRFCRRTPTYLTVLMPLTKAAHPAIKHSRYHRSLRRSFPYEPCP